jgi:hypothetical protein
VVESSGNNLTVVESQPNNKLTNNLTNNLTVVESQPNNKLTNNLTVVESRRWMPADQANRDGRIEHRRGRRRGQGS